TSLRRDLVLINGRKAGMLLGDDAADALGEDLGHVRNMSDHLERRPLTELLAAESLRSDRADDARERGRVVREGERCVVVISQPFHDKTLPRSASSRRELARRERMWSVEVAQQMQTLREVVMGSALVVLLLVAAGVSWSTSRVAASVATAMAAPSAAPVRSGPAFTVCPSDTTWRTPRADQR